MLLRATCSGLLLLDVTAKLRNLFWLESDQLGFNVMNSTRGVAIIAMAILLLAALLPLMALDIALFCTVLFCI